MNTIKAEVLADELNLPSEVAQKFKGGKRLSITVVKDGILLKPVGDPIAEAHPLKGRLDTEKFLRLK